MGASPELFREVDGSRIAAVSVFFRSLAAIAPACAPTHCHKAVTDRFSFDEQSRSKQRGDDPLVAIAATLSCSIEHRESNNGFCSAIFNYAWLHRVTRSSLTGQIATKRLRTNRNIASHKPC
jgi:hypothetical protein